MSAAACPCCGAPVDPDRILIDRLEGVIAHSGKSVYLQPAMFRLLEALHTAMPGIVSNDTLYEICGRNRTKRPEPKTVHVHISRLRHLLKPLGLGIRTNWGVGYGLVVGASQPHERRAVKFHLRDHHDERLKEWASNDVSFVEMCARIRAPQATVARRLKKLGLEVPR